MILHCFYTDDNVRQQGGTLTTKMPLWTQAYHRLGFWCRRWSMTRTKTKDGKYDTDKFFKAANKLPEWERKWFAVRFPGVKVLSFYFTNFMADEEICYPKSFWDPQGRKAGKGVLGTSYIDSCEKEVTQDRLGEDAD